MRILALDLGTITGWAVGEDGRLKESGIQIFELRRGESPGMRFLRFNAWLERMKELADPLVVVYEQTHHRGGAATEIAAGFATRVQEWAAKHTIAHAVVHSATLKKFATGNGRASKEEMIKAMQERWNWTGGDDNEADALAVLAWALREFGK